MSWFQYVTLWCKSVWESSAQHSWSPQGKCESFLVVCLSTVCSNKIFTKDFQLVACVLKCVRVSCLFIVGFRVCFKYLQVWRVKPGFKNIPRQLLFTLLLLLHSLFTIFYYISCSWGDGCASCIVCIFSIRS